MFFDFINTKASRSSSRESAVYTDIAKVWGSSPRYSDVNYRTISKEGYSENHVFFRCLTEIIKGCQRVKWCVKKKVGDEIEDYNDHPILEVLNKPNNIQSKSEFIKRLIAFYYIGGEAPLHKISTSVKGVKSLYTYRPDRVSFTCTGDTEMPYKDITYQSGHETSIDPDKFTLFKNFNPLDDMDGLGHGMSMMQPALKNGDLLNAFIDWNVSLLQNGARPSGAFVTEHMLEDDEYERAHKQLKQKNTGTRNAGKLLLLEGGLSYVKMGENPKDMDWKEGKDSTIIDICCALGVDPILIGYNKFSSYNNKKEAKKDLYTSTVIPLIMELSGILTHFLELEEDYYIEGDFSNVSVLQEDEKEKYDRIEKAKYLTINEKRQMVGKDTIDGGDIVGDALIIDGKVYIPLNLQIAGEDGGEE